MVSRPPSGIASRALTARLRMAFSSWFGSIAAFHRPPASTVSMVTVSPSVRCSRSDMPCTSRLMSTDFTSSGCWREKASRRCTRVAARSAAWRQLDSQVRTRSSAGDAAQREIEIADDGGEQIVEVVRDAAGEAADRLHLLRLAQRFLGRLAPRDLVAQHPVGGGFAPRAAQRQQAERDHRGGRRKAEDQMARHAGEPGLA